MWDVGTEDTKLKTGTFTKQNVYDVYEMLDVGTEDTKLKTGTFTKQNVYGMLDAGTKDTKLKIWNIYQTLKCRQKFGCGNQRYKIKDM